MTDNQMEAEDSTSDGEVKTREETWNTSSLKYTGL